MPYVNLPTTGSFPYSPQDILKKMQLLEEQWKRLYQNQIKYFSLVKKLDRLSNAAPPSPDSLVNLNSTLGAFSATKLDPLYGEPVPATQDGSWQQPHLSGLSVANNEVFADPKLFVNARVIIEAKDYQLKRWGFDRLWGLGVIIPAITCDKLSLVLKPGDEHEWNGVRYTIKQAVVDKFWLQSDIPLTLVMNCENKRLGS